MSRRAASLAALVALVLGLLIAPPAAAEPELDSAQLQAGLDGLAEVGAVGAVARVSVGGETWSGASGDAAPEDTFRAGSVTKMLVAVMALKMVQHGRWTMRTTIGDVLPGVWPERNGVTVRQLLSHTSGMPDYLASYAEEATSVQKLKQLTTQRRTDVELIGRAKQEKWLFRPGTGFAYSNTNFVVLAGMLEFDTGQPLVRIAQRMVFDPAGMEDSSVARGVPGFRAQLRDVGLLGKRTVSFARMSPTLFSAAGLLVTTTADLDRFQVALSSGRLLEKKQLRAMRSVVGEELGYGLGSYRLPDPCAKGEFVHGHDGVTFGTQTMSFSRPDGSARVTVAMSGRDFGDTKGTQLTALGEYVTAAFAQTC